MADSTLNPELLKKYAGGIEVFCETGTAKGEGLSVALEHGFKKLYSIEANPVTFAKAAARFAGESRVNILMGDGGKVLAELLPTITEPCVFWLDSHWSTGEDPLGPGVSPCPLLSELGAIANHQVKGHVILIDDCRYFWKGIDQWRNITMSEIIWSVTQINPDYWFHMEPGVSANDILVARVPQCRLHEAVEAMRG